MRTTSDSERRTRRARYLFVVTAAAAAFVAVAALAIVRASGPAEPVPAPGASRSSVFGEHGEANVVAVWSRLHVGWVYVYDDGRVLLRPDSGRRIGPHGGFVYGILERHLSASGLQLARAGALDLEEFLVGSSSPPSIWSHPTQAQYWPSAFALCLVNTVPRRAADPEWGPLLDIDDIHSRLPDMVRAILRDGIAESYTVDAPDAGLDGVHGMPGPGVGCVVLSPERILDLWAQTRTPEGDRGVMRISEPSFGTLTGADGAEFLVIAIPVLPHGGWVLWGG